MKSLAIFLITSLFFVCSTHAQTFRFSNQGFDAVLSVGDRSKESFTVSFTLYNTSNESIFLPAGNCVFSEWTSKNGLMFDVGMTIKEFTEFGLSLRELKPADSVIFTQNVTSRHPDAGKILLGVGFLFGSKKAETKLLTTRSIELKNWGSFRYDLPLTILPNEEPDK